MEHRIRPAVDADKERIRLLVPRLGYGVAAWRDPAAVENSVLAWVDDALNHLDEEDRAVLVAEESDAVVGFITVAAQAHWSGATDAYIGELVVEGAAEGRGIGSALVRAAIEWSRQRGIEIVSVSTGAANARARRLYEALGFLEEDITFGLAIGPESPSG